MNNTERDEAIKRLERRQTELLEMQRNTSDFHYKNELAARSSGIEEALQEFDPNRRKASCPNWISKIS